MSHPAPTSTVNVDVTNPGQFFACCGLFELAERLRPGVEAWFHDGTFQMNQSMSEIIEKLRHAQYRLVDLSPADLRARSGGKDVKSPKTIQPFEIKFENGSPITLDWWLAPFKHHGLKLWSGSNSLGTFVEDVFAAIRKDESQHILTASFQLRHQPFFFAATRPLHERHFGISMDKLKLEKREFQHFPYVELLAIIGLQRFRPAVESHGLFRYCSWRASLPASLASAVVCGMVSPLIQETFKFPVIDRDDNGHRQFIQAERIPNV